MAILYMIGLGLGDETDVSVKGRDIILKSEKVYLESYTSLLNIDVEKLKAYYQKDIIVAYRETVEIEMDEILKSISHESNHGKIFSFLVVGDPFCATTHSDLYLRAIKLGIKVHAIHNASIINAVGICGMQLYNYGQIVSIPFFTEKWKPYSFLEKIAFNYQNNMHTLVLLDIRVKEISDENLAKGKKIYDPPKFMSVNVAIEQIFEAEDNLKTEKFGDVRKLKGFGVARVGSEHQVIRSGTLEQLLTYDFGAPLHSVVICAKTLHCIEEEMFDHFSGKSLDA
jgi:diphthine synthase